MDGEGVITWGHVVGVITERGGGGGVVNCEICQGWNRCEQAYSASCEPYQIKCKTTLCPFTSGIQSVTKQMNTVWKYYIL